MVRRPRTQSVRPIGFKPNVIKPTQIVGLTPVFWINVLLGVIALIVFIVYPDSVEIQPPAVGFSLDSEASNWKSDTNNINRLIAESENTTIDINPIITQIMDKETPQVFKTIVKSTVCVQPVSIQKDVDGNDARITWGVQSGVFFTPRGMTGNPGYIITTFDAIDGADFCYVVMHDKQSVRAEVVGGDPQSNIGVLKIDERLWTNKSNYKPIKVASEVVQGEPVCNCGGTDEWGTAYGDVDLQFSFFHGTLSNAKRAYSLKLRNGQTTGKYSYYYQISAPIGPGVSGGPTVNSNGEVLGINMNFLNTDTITEEFGYSFNYVRGLNFVLPIGYALKVADSLVSSGKVDRSYLGLDFQIISSNDNLKSLIISHVEPGSPSEKAGIHAGDELLIKHMLCLLI